MPVLQKWLLLGADGQLGNEWKSRLSKQENPIRLLAYNKSQLDITEFGKVEEAIKREKPPVIINCAAYTRVDEAEEKRKLARKVNADAVRNLAELCADYKVKLVHYSTDYVFSGDKKDAERFPEGYPEEHKSQPVNWYGQTKWQGEQAIRSSNCEHLILRLSWLCSVYGSNFITSMLQLAETNKQLNVVNDQKASPTFAENVVNNTLSLMEKDKDKTYHLTSSGIISWATFAKTIFKYTDKEVGVEMISSEQFPTVAERPRFSKLNTQKAEQVEGVEIEDWKTGLQSMLRRLNI